MTTSRNETDDQPTKRSVDHVIACIQRAARRGGMDASESVAYIREVARTDMAGALAEAEAELDWYSN